MFNKLPEKKYYSISEVATHFNVNTSLLRFWEKEFKEINPMIKSSGIRKYTKENIESISIIYTLLKKDGLTIQGAKKKLKSNLKNLISATKIKFLYRTNLGNTFFSLILYFHLGDVYLRFESKQSADMAEPY